MRYWVIKGKPSENEFDEMLIPGRRETWHTAAPRKDWAKGDRLFFWASSPAKQLIGLGIIRGIHDEKNEFGDSLFDVKYLTTKFTSPLSMDDLRQYFADDLPSFLKANVAGTVYTLTTEQGEHLFRLAVFANPEWRDVWSDIAIDETATIPDIDTEYFSGAEGGKVFVTHLRRERNRKVVEAKKSQVLKQTGTLECEVCGFNFENVYGSVGRGFCETHHIKPLSEINKATETKLKDLAIICSNCHRMIHRTRPIKSIKDFKEWLRTKSNKSFERRAQ